MPAPRLSIILAVPGAPAQMEDTLVSILQNRPSACEVIVVLNRPYEDPYELQGEVRFLDAPPGSQLVPMLNLAIAQSRAPLFHVLTCGIRVTEGWVEPALDAFRENDVAAVIPLVLDRQGRLISAGTSYERRGRVRRLVAGGNGAAPSDPRDALIDPDFCAAFYRRAALEYVGHFSDALGDRLSGLDLGLALQAAGYRSLLVPDCRVSVDRRSRGSLGWYQRGRASERLFWRWLPRQGRWTCLVQHAWIVAGESARTFLRPQRILQLAGRVAGVLQKTTPRQVAPPMLGTRSRASVLKGPHFARLAKDQAQGAVEELSGPC